MCFYSPRIRLFPKKQNNTIICTTYIFYGLFRRLHGNDDDDDNNEVKGTICICQPPFCLLNFSSYSAKFFSLHIFYTTHVYNARMSEIKTFFFAWRNADEIILKVRCWKISSCRSRPLSLFCMYKKGKTKQRKEQKKNEAKKQKDDNTYRDLSIPFNILINLI